MFQAGTDNRYDDHPQRGYRVNVPARVYLRFRDHNDSPECGHHLEADVHDFRSSHAMNSKQG
jgi:hypothetical protein